MRLSDLQKLAADNIDLGVLKDAGVVSPLARRAKVILSGEIKRRITLKGLLASKGAKAAIEAQGGVVEMAQASTAGAQSPDKE